jgi:hypothetical protein
MHGKFHLQNSVKYCGVFTPCNKYNIETRSSDYATLDEVVFSPCRAETISSMPWRVAHRLASRRLVCCQATTIYSWMTQVFGGVTWQRQQWRHPFQQWRNNWSTVGRSVIRSSRRETAAGSSWVASCVQSSCEDLNCDVKTLCIL